MAAMGNVSLILGLFFIVFGILGVQLFAGRLYSCNDTSVEDKSECVGEFLSTTPPTDGARGPRASAAYYMTA